MKAERKQAKADHRQMRDMELAGRERAREKKRAAAAFAASPVGKARAARERGDKIFQCEFELRDSAPRVAPMVGATTSTQYADPSTILNAICAEGWDMLSGSFVFHELGSESRDRFLASGQQTAVKGIVVGYYLFRRCDENRAA